MASEDLASPGAGKENESSQLARPLLVSLAILYLYLVGSLLLVVALLTLGSDPQGGSKTCEIFGKGMSGSACDAWSVPVSPLVLLFAELLRRNVRWTREALFGLVLLYGLHLVLKSWHLALPPTLLDPRIVAVVLCGFAYWYFYRKPNAKACCESLRRDQVPSR